MVTVLLEYIDHLIKYVYMLAMYTCTKYISIKYADCSIRVKISIKYLGYYAGIMFDAFI